MRVRNFVKVDTTQRLLSDCDTMFCKGTRITNNFPLLIDKFYEKKKKTNKQFNI